MAKSKDAVKIAFIDWLANPESEGTQQDFAREFKVHEGTLSDWKNEPGFWDRVWERFTDFYLQGQLPAVNRALIRKAKAGDYQAMQLVYKVAKRITDKLELTGKDGQPLEVKIVRPETWNASESSSEKG
ncbi:MAG: hypothetical protein H5T71_04655 [Chloroflexi bacterium]|nr:hypothetical protein [Chloroflexota bacterium]